jgi:hypothetical protein
MRDVVFVAVIIAFFALASLYITACARLIGQDEPALVDTVDTEGPEDGSRELEGVG